MKSWLILLGGLIVWAIHFFGIYAIAEIRPDARLVIGLSMACLAADLWLLRQGCALPADDSFARWRRRTAVCGSLLSLLAVGWQTLPAFL